MLAIYSDEEIFRMIKTRKLLPKNYRAYVQLREKRGHKEREMDLKGDDGAQYRLIFRQSDFNTLDFSIILALTPSDSNQLFHLRRYNGKSHEHTNQIEDQTFYDFHIHEATKRYQESGSREDAFAKPTKRYADFNGALHCMLEDCGFETPQEAQGQLFEDCDL
jgi:hypothetical protein